MGRGADSRLTILKGILADLSVAAVHTVLSRASGQLRSVWPYAKVFDYFKASSVNQLRNTHFAPAERATSESIADARKAFLSDPRLPTMIDALPELVLVLNGQRQIVAMNRVALASLGIEDPSCLVGQRPGEALGCSNAEIEAGGCGTARPCSTCGAVRAILDTLATGRQMTQECRITTEREGGAAFDFKVVATPLPIDGGLLVVTVMRDISAEKRRGILERAFFHDVMNTVSGLQGLACSLAAQELPPSEEREYMAWMAELTKELSEEIQYHRAIKQAEAGEFSADRREVFLPEFMKELYALYARHIAAHDRLLRLSPVPEIKILTDPTLLRRVLGNLVKNALEATPAGGYVSLICETGEREVHFRVNNLGVMPEAVQLQLFRRSFTTKGETGRGIGTYSVKLLGEKYLGGKVDFFSAEPEGTTFTLTLPAT
jgi:PAS domain-containing protein